MGWKHVRRAFLILGGAAVVVTILLLFAQDQETLRIRSAVSAEDPRHPAYIAALAGAALTSGNRFKVLTNGDEIFPPMLEAIRGADRRISFESYIYNSDSDVGRQFTDALEEAARRGVRVNLVLDAVGASAISQDHRNRLREAGAIVALFNSPNWWALEEVNYRTHRKILVVDGTVAYTGGVGVDDHWKGNARNKDEWRDSQFEIRGPLARLIEAGFYENYIETAGIVMPELDEVVPAHDEDGQAFIVRSSPTGGASDLKRLYLLGIAAAKRTLEITTPYFVPDESTLWAIEDARRRGVRVRILVESDLTDAMPVKYASRHFYDRLLQQGVEIYEYQPTMMHAKTIVADGIWSMFGSANFDNRSLELNDELNVAVTNRGLAERILADFENDLKVSKQLELETWRERSLLAKARERFWSLFGEIF